LSAFDQIEDAFAEIDAASTGNHTILLREGLYRPTPAPSTATSPRERTFTISQFWGGGRIRIVGGFLGGPNGGDNPDAPDGSPVRTILDGRAFNQAGVTVGPAFHVMTVASSTLPQLDLSVENLLITGGRADDYMGLTGPHGARGGAVLMVRSASRILFDKVTFLDNHAGPPNGVIPTQRGEGGAIAVLQLGTTSNANFSLKRCAFSNNHAEFGAAVFVNTSPSLRIGNCRFIENGFFLQDTSNDDAPTECVEGGGLFLGPFVSSQMNNTVFQDNMARDSGAAIHWGPFAGPNFDNTQTLHHCTIAFNRITVPANGAGLHVTPTNQAQGVRSLDLLNSIVWGNIGGNDVVVVGNPGLGQGGATINEWYCNIGTQEAVTTVAPGGIFPISGNISADPLFVSPATRNLALQSTPIASPSINSGGAVLSIPLPPNISNAIGLDFLDIDDDMDFLELLPLDFNLQPRNQGAGPDMGAYEQ